MSQDDNLWRYSLQPEEVLHFAFPTDMQSYNELVGVFPPWGEAVGDGVGAEEASRITWCVSGCLPSGGEPDRNSVDMGSLLAKRALSLPTSSERLRRSCLSQTY